MKSLSTLQENTEAAMFQIPNDEYTRFLSFYIDLSEYGIIVYLHILQDAEE